MKDHAEIRDCALLARAAYMHTEVEMKAYLASKSHRFNGGITCSNLANDKGHFVLAERTLNGTTTIYLAIRGSISLEDWGTNVQAWPTLQEMGMVHAGWYTRMLHLPQQLLLQRIKDGHRVVICGHSLGGAVAQLLTVSMLQSFIGDAKERDYRSNIMCYSFAGPMVIVGGGADAVNNRYKHNFVNFVHSKDVVPKIMTFAQSALKEFTGIRRYQGSALPLAKMLRSIADPTDCSGLVSDVIAKGMAALQLSSAVRAALQYQPIGVYCRVDTAAGGPLLPLSDADLSAMMIWENVTVSPDLVLAHRMELTYLDGVLALLDASATGQVVGSEPKSLVLPRPVVHRIDLRRSGKEVLVRIVGAHLYAIQRVVSSQLPLCKLDHVVTPTALVSSEQLLFRIPRTNDRDKGTAAGSPTIGANLIGVPGICWNDDIIFPPVPVRIIDTHPLDLFSLQELVTAGMYLLLFVSREPAHSGHPHFQALRNLLLEVFATVPPRVFFIFPSPVAAYCFENHAETAVAVLMRDERGREMLDEYISQGEAFYDTNPNADEGKAVKAQMELLGNLKRQYIHAYDVANISRQQDLVKAASKDILTLLAVCHDPPLEGHAAGLKVMLEILAGPLEQARAALQQDLNAENYQTFLGALALGLGSISFLTLPVGKFFNKDQTELGPLNDALMAFINNPTVRLAIQAVSTGLVVGGGVAGLAFFGNLFMWMVVTGAVFNPILLYAYIGMAALGFNLWALASGFPSRVVRSSAGLRDAVLKHFRVRVPDGASVGEQELALANYILTARGLGPFCRPDELQELVQDCFHYVDTGMYRADCKEVRLRLKLTILSSHLRTVLKNLPIVLLTGPTRAGKSTLREHMQGRPPDRTKFGHRAKQRTSVPELFFCGDAARPVCLLDSIGIGDATSENVSSALDQATKMFRLFCQASIIVVNEGETSAAGRNLLHHTSTVPRRDPTAERPVIHHPTMTCITNVDRIASGVGNSFPENEGGPEALREEAEHRIARGQPFDLRNPAEDPFTPRVMACFESRIHIPEEYRSIVYSTDDVKQWLYSHFYPTNAEGAQA